MDVRPPMAGMGARDGAIRSLEYAPAARRAIAARPEQTVLGALLRKQLRLVVGVVTFGRHSRGRWMRQARPRFVLSCICVPEADLLISLLERHESRFPQWMRKR